MVLLMLQSFTQDRIAPTIMIEVFSRILIAGKPSDMEEANVLQSEMTDEEIRRVFIRRG